jgi:hypothetical protein
LQLRHKDQSAILVGTGDNFAPELEARVFEPRLAGGGGPYERGNKELFNWNGDAWIPYEKTTGLERENLSHGLGTIPNDNVGCFLAAAKYTAVVPGKHDFYFGAERVRQFARFLAGFNSPAEAGDTPPAKYAPVQMLGANLVLKTVPITDQPLLPREIKAPPFKTEWPKEYSVLNLQDRTSVYPWFSYAKINLVALKLDAQRLDYLQNWFSEKGLASESGVKEFLRSQNDEDFSKVLESLTKAIDDFPYTSVLRCDSQSDPNDVDPRTRPCTPIVERKVGLVGNSLAYFFEFPALYQGKDGHFSNLTSGKNYGFCSKDKGGEWYCLRFAVHTPFFYFPHQVPQSTNNFTDPDPYVLTEDGTTAVFGVVDNDLGSRVGVLNFGWHNTKPNLKTVVSAEDPAQALREQLDYFQRRYWGQNKRAFTGLKVLLAQMSPQRARVLAARLPDFQVVVTGADEEQGTSLTRLDTQWRPNTRAGSFVAVPLPIYNRASATVAVNFSWVDASQKVEMRPLSWADESQKVRTWRLSSDWRDPVLEYKPKSVRPAQFWLGVDKALQTCLPSYLRDKLNDTPKPSDSEKLKWLTLCAIREKTNADVALIQKRDFFDQIPEGTEDSPDRAQQILDRLIWKGDLLTLMYVPGSAIKEALAQSKKYKAEDASALSLADEKSRQLEILGIETDKATNEPLINEVPIDDKKIYAVATSDYIGAGDTGYPALAAKAINPRTYPGGFPNQLLPISSVVCRKIFPDQSQAKDYCLDDIDREKYLDETIAEQITPFKRPTFGKRFWDNFLFKSPPKESRATTVSGGLEQRVQRHPFWLFSLRNFSLGITSLGNNFTDAEIDEKFAGVSTSSVQAHKKHSVTIGLNTRLAHLTHKREFFLAGGIDYKKESTGISNDTPLVNQIANRAFADVGVTVRFPGRSIPHVGAVFSVHFETPLEQPFTTFTLSTQTVVDPVNDIKVNDRLKITQGRSLMILPRAGLRWQNRDGSFEFGFQAGREINALNGYRFNTQGVLDECLPNAAKSFATCIKEKSKTPNATITKNSDARAIQQDRPRVGLYWKTNLSIPFGEKFKYELEQEASFFLDFQRDNAIDTRFFDSSKHRFRFFIWPSLSIGPTVRLLLFQNKVNREFLFQRELTFETSFSFDLFNRREKGVQFKNKP